jgi:hypothetical protein
MYNWETPFAETIKRYRVCNKTSATVTTLFLKREAQPIQLWFYFARGTVRRDGYSTALV